MIEYKLKILSKDHAIIRLKYKAHSFTREWIRTAAGWINTGDKRLHRQLLEEEPNTDEEVLALMRDLEVETEDVLHRYMGLYR